MTSFVCLDFETNGVDVKSCEVAQTALAVAPADEQGRPDLSAVSCSEIYSCVTSMPTEASAVNGLTFERLKDERPFIGRARAVLNTWTQPGVIGVTFNGERFDLAVLARYAAAHGRMTSFVESVQGGSAVDRFAQLLSRNHVDVARVWQVVRAKNIRPPWTLVLGCACAHCDRFDCDGCGPGFGLTSRNFGRDLAGAFGFYHGRDFAGAHDASADTKATLSTLREMLAAEHVTLDEALRLSSTPSPGDVDIEGRFKWVGDQAVTAFGQHEGTPLEKSDRGYLLWMLGSDFHWHTKQIVRDFLAGRYPERKYEDESL